MYLWSLSFLFVILFGQLAFTAPQQPQYLKEEFEIKCANVIVLTANSWLGLKSSGNFYCAAPSIETKSGKKYIILANGYLPGAVLGAVVSNGQDDNVQFQFTKYSEICLYFKKNPEVTELSVDRSIMTANEILEMYDGIAVLTGSQKIVFQDNKEALLIGFNQENGEAIYSVVTAKYCSQ